jgi:hypothetical protein
MKSGDDGRVWHGVGCLRNVPPRHHPAFCSLDTIIQYRQVSMTVSFIGEASLVGGQAGTPLSRPSRRPEYSLGSMEAIVIGLQLPTSDGSLPVMGIKMTLFSRHEAAYPPVISGSLKSLGMMEVALARISAALVIPSSPVEDDGLIR